MEINKLFDKLFEEYLTLAEGQLTLPIYCGGSIVKDEDENKIYSIDLHLFSTWAARKTLAPLQADFIRKFIQEKINNGTLYTPTDMIDYPLTKRFQLFVNSNIAEHTVVDILNGILLEGNDLLTIDSTAIIGDDGCALADVTIDSIEVEVKVTRNLATRDEVLKKAHKKPVVAIYTIAPGSAPHWRFYIRGDAGNYVTVDFAIGHNYINSNTNERYLSEVVDKAIIWQEKMITLAPKLPLLHFEDKADGSLEITAMAH